MIDKNIMRKNSQTLFFTDMVLAIFIFCLLFYGKISAAEFHQPQRLKQTKNVFHLQESVGRGGTMQADAGIETDESQNKIQTEKKKIALTFDDGPDPKYTPLLLEGLRDRGVQATFFLLGRQIDMYPEIVEEMYADGHEIGVHSYEHINLEMISESEACEQIQKTGDLICGLTGEWPSYVRPPYGNWPSVLDDDFCMVTVLWSVDPLDWTTENASLILQRILENVEEYDIILLHDASASSVEAAFQAIDILQREGYQFVTVEDLIFP